MQTARDLGNAIRRCLRQAGITATVKASGKALDAYASVFPSAVSDAAIAAACANAGDALRAEGFRVIESRDFLTVALRR